MSDNRHRKRPPQRPFPIEGVDYFPDSLRRSAQRRFIASAMRLRPSGLSLRLVVVTALAAFADLAAFAAFLLPLGRPRRPVFAAAGDAVAAVDVVRPLREALISSSFATSASISAMMLRT